LRNKELFIVIVEKNVDGVKSGEAKKTDERQHRPSKHRDD
jgi:hypothetical protein